MDKLNNINAAVASATPNVNRSKDVGSLDRRSVSNSNLNLDSRSKRPNSTDSLQNKSVNTTKTLAETKN